MFFYSFAANNHIHHIIIDESGIPVRRNSTALDSYPDTPHKKNMINHPNLLIFGEAVPLEEGEDLKTQFKKPVTYYIDKPVEEIFLQMESPEDWEEFFEEEEIAYELSKSPTIYHSH